LTGPVLVFNVFIIESKIIFLSFIDYFFHSFIPVFLLFIFKQGQYFIYNDLLTKKMSVTKLISSSSNSKISCKFISKFIEKVDYTPVSLLDKGKKE